MKFHELSAADQQLLNTDLGDFDKLAEEQMALADEMYSVGFSKLAAETADYLDSMFEKAAAEEEKEEEEGDEEEEKKASELGAFIERGYFDGLRKLGSERYDDEMAYLYPFIEEKVAAKGAKAAKGALEKAWGAFKSYHTKGVKQLKASGKPLKEAVTGKSSKGGKLGWKSRGEKAKAGLLTAGKGAVRFAPHAAGLGAVGYGANRAYKKSKEQD